jgi:DNA-binding transcriptional LysR family regulator
VEKIKRKLAAVEPPPRGIDVNWNEVYYFSKIASVGSIKGAAEQLELSPSTLSLHLSQLEADLQVKLFHREHRKLTLTHEGSRLFIHAKSMFESGQRLLDVVSPLSVGSYPVSVAIVPSPSVQMANRILGKYVKAQSGLNMKIFRAGYEELEQGILDAQFDFGFLDRVPERKALFCHKVSHAKIQFFVAPKWADIPFSRILQMLPLLICNAEPDSRSFAEQSLLEAEFVSSSVVTSDYPSTLLELCQQGAGIGVFSETTFQGQGLRGLTSLRAPRDAPVLHDSLYAVWHKEAEATMAIRSLREILELPLRGKGEGARSVR